MDIKKIIREEFDDLDWVRESQPTGKYKIWLGRTTIENQNKALKHLFDLGVRIGIRNKDRVNTVTDLGKKGGVIITSLFIEYKDDKLPWFDGWNGTHIINTDDWYMDDNGDKWVSDEILDRNLEYFNAREGIDISMKDLI